MGKAGNSCCRERIAGRFDSQVNAVAVFSDFIMEIDIERIDQHVSTELHPHAAALYGLLQVLPAVHGIYPDQQQIRKGKFLILSYVFSPLTSFLVIIHAPDSIKIPQIIGKIITFSISDDPVPMTCGI